MTQPPTGVPGTAPAVLTNEKLLHRLSHPTVHAPKRRKNPPDPNRSRPQRPKTRRKKGRRR